MTNSCTVGQKKNTAINSNKNYNREMKLVPINVDYSVLQFDALKFVLRIDLHGGSMYLTNFFSINPQI